MYNLKQYTCNPNLFIKIVNNFIIVLLFVLLINKINKNNKNININFKKSIINFNVY